MLRKKAANELLNKLHRGFVLSCVALTIGGCGLLGMNTFRYFTVVRPAIKERQLEAQQELLGEGAETLTDAAPSVGA
ncbi:uncharacterized protein LOC124741220 [Schistocerca piceifrons]|uniref:uncharacterized protein LOC124741220 n=1 Tax=Schistocerca piceifrons TaxID=274613 RepID=UPI001F5FB80B|nr:uncharacterized protein LOC124741220 [Schistocerca piceifrons]